MDPLVQYMRELRQQGVGTAMTEEEHLKMLKDVEWIEEVAKRRLGPFAKSTYGKKGQTGANSGRKVSIYEGILPDNDGVRETRTVRKRSYNVNSPNAFISCFKRAGVWIVGGVWKEPNPDLGITFIPAKRIK